MSILANVEPHSVFRYFEEICRIPHGSGNTKAISDYLVSFAKARSLRYRQDPLNNVIIWKNATPGYQDSPAVMLQGHLDMVCEQAPDCHVDMTKEALDLFVEGDVIGARGTTLGGDDGIAVAMCLAILDSEEIPHGPLECVFTVDEEVGMLGASALDVSDLKAGYLINLDSEVEGVFTVSCAGSTRVVCSFPVQRSCFSGKTCVLRVSGLLGGHSGMEIHKNRLNSLTLTGRVLYELSQACGLRIIDISGGTKDNAIPRGSDVLLAVDDVPAAQAVIECVNAALKKEYRASDGNARVSFLEAECAAVPMDRESTQKIITFLYCVPNGVQMMSPDMPGLVQTSLNLGQVSTQDASVTCRIMVRSGIDSQKDEIAGKVIALAGSLGGSAEIPTKSPAWEYKPDSPLRDTAVRAFRSVYGKDPQISGMHGGLECGVLSGKMPRLDCLSYGPDLTDIHTPDERLHIASAKRVWDLTLEILKQLKKQKTMSKKETSITFTGDIGFDRYMDGRWEDDKLLSGSVLAFLQSSDHVAANVEGALIDAVDDGSRGTFFHAMNPAITKVLNDIGADIWCIGNNHTMDAGLQGLRSTMALAKENGCLTIGAGMNETEASEPVYLEEAGGIGMFGVAYLSECIPATADDPGIFRWNDMDLIAKRIAEIKGRCRWCIVVSHGGEEFASLPNPYTRDRYLQFLELGADIVVAHHPHVPENYEIFDNGKAIFYSLGNFIFDTNYQRAHPYTDTGLLLKLILSEKEMRFEAMGIRIVRGEERIEEAPLPDIFTDIPEAEYALLSPLSTKAFVLENRRTMIYLEPDKYRDAPEEVWNAYFFSEDTDGFYKGQHMDFNVLLPFAETAEEGAWKRSRLEKVRDYILHQFDFEENS